MTESQQAELDHLTKLAKSATGWRIYAEDKARRLAQEQPKR